MSNKKINIFEGSRPNDKASVRGTDIILKETGTGKVLFRGKNKVLVSGSEFNAIKDFMFNNIDNFQEFNYLSNIKTYDEALSFSEHKLYFPDKLYAYKSGNISSSQSFTNEPYYKEHGGVLFTNATPLIAEQLPIYMAYTNRVYLFCVGIDGCGIENSRVFKVQNTKFIAPYKYAKFDSGNGLIDESITNCLIPFVMRDSNSDLNKEERQLYFGRSVVDNKISYYFKSFDNPPTLIRRYADDSTDLENVEDVWADERLSEAEVVVQLKMSISPTDCREYFEYTTGTNTSKINTISLCTAIPYMGSDDQLYYKDIRPFTKFNFPNESLINTSKGIDITYYLYY